MNKIILVLLSLWVSLPLFAERICYEESDSIQVESLLREARILPGEANRILFFARELTGRPYKAGTLEREPEEVLTVNLRELDCMTFVETVLALAVADKAGRCSFHDYVEAVRSIRYRNGMIDGYCSRLHYFTDWVNHNSADNKLLVEVTGQLGKKITRVRPNIHFMSSHANLYAHLKNNGENIRKIKEVEKELALSGEVPLIEKGRKDFHRILGNIEEGNVIALTSTVDGLDVSHMGIAVRKQGEIYLLHASSRYRKVLEEPVSLREYLKSQPGVSGIRVLKLLF